MNKFLLYPVPILATIQLLLVVVHLFVFVSVTYARTKHGKEVDTGLIQKRVNNVNFYTQPTLASGDPTGTRYPIGSDPANPKRIDFVKFSKCPPFRLSDDSKSVLVG